MTAWTISADGSAKRVWMSGGMAYETGYFPYQNYDSVCVSSQAGCNVGCTFCLTGKSRNSGNLTVEQILEQIRDVTAFRRPGMPLKVSFQGMGEPLLNYEAVRDAIRAARDEELAERFGISTIGYPSRIAKLASDIPFVKLQVSLHSTQTQERLRLIPGSRASSVSDILVAAQGYREATGSPVVANYLLLSGVNDKPSHARELVEHMQTLAPDVRLKISKLNEHHDLFHRASTAHDEKAFMAVLAASGVAFYSFKSRGTDVLGGCGQFNPRYGPVASRTAP